MVMSLQESAIKDILDAIEDIKKLDDSSFFDKRQGGSMNVSSISRASKDLIMSFPVLCDNSIEPKTASMICKALERKAVTMLQLIFASCSFDNVQDGREVIKKWHNNIDGGNLSLDDYLDLVDKYTESVESLPYSKQRDILALEKAVLENHKEEGFGKTYPYPNFSESSVNDFRVTSRYDGNPVVLEVKRVFDTDDDFNKAVKDRINDVRTIANTQATINKNNREERESNVDFLHQTLMDNDIKKCNELVPSLMIIQFYDNNNNAHQFVAGVKTRLIGVDGYDIAERIESKNKDRAGLVNLVRATTKEISFVKDYLLAINKAKIEAKRNSIRNGGANRIWKTLEKRATKSVWKRMTAKTNDAGAITSLVVSQQLVNMIKKEYDIDLTNVKTASAIMDAYNLLCLCIVDESIEVARFLYDGDSWFEEMSFDSLERETGDGSYKKVINLLSKMK